MDVLLVYDSYYGNTLRVAELYQQEFASKGIMVEVKHVSKIFPEDIDHKKLLIFGSPTRAFRETPAIKQLLKNKRFAFENRPFFVFDTRIDPQDTNSALLHRLVRWFGYASGHMNKLLSKRGASQISTDKGYCVMSSEGPLKPEVSHQVADHVTEIVPHFR
jgi:flavodoxin